MPMEHCIGNGTDFRLLSLAPSSLIALLSVLGCGGSRVQPSSLFSICAVLLAGRPLGRGSVEEQATAVIEPRPARLAVGRDRG